MKRLVLLLGLLLFGIGLQAQNNYTGNPGFNYGNLTTAGDGTDCATNPATTCLAVPIPQSYGSATISLQGTFSATVQFEATTDGTNWVSINAYPLNSTTAATSATGTGIWTMNVSGVLILRARISTYASGTVAVTIRASPAASAKQGGGGGRHDQQCSYLQQ